MEGHRVPMIAVDTNVLGLSNVYIEKADQLAKALSWSQHGMDFADTLHLPLADGAHRLVTFDERFVKSAAPLRLPVQLLK